MAPAGFQALPDILGLLPAVHGVAASEAFRLDIGQTR